MTTNKEYDQHNLLRREKKQIKNYASGERCGFCVLGRKHQRENRRGHRQLGLGSGLNIQCKATEETPSYAELSIGVLSKIQIG
jgi:hypothetical protein